MQLAKAIVGSRLVGIAVKIVPKESKKMVLKKPHRFKLSNKSGRRTGRLSEAFVDIPITKEKSGKFTPFLSDFVELIRNNLSEIYNITYDVFLKDEVIKGRQLIGECSKYKGPCLVPRHAACHQGQKIIMFCGNGALCYVDVSVEPTVAWMKN